MRQRTVFSARLLMTAVLSFLLVLGCAFVSLADETAEKPAINATAQITGCTIDAGRTTVTITATGSGDATGTDGQVYVVEMGSWQNDLAGRTDYVTSAPISSSYTFTFPLNAGTDSDRSYKSFILAVWDGTQYQALTSRHFITNPEIAAKDKSTVKITGKKGLAVDTTLLNDAISLGIKQAKLDMAVNQMQGTGISYTWKGKTYNFSKDYFDKFDHYISTLSNRGVLVTAVILNGWSDSSPDLYLPGLTNDGKHPYYVFNTTTEAGENYVEAVANFLAERYNGSNGHGKIFAWVIGNEINHQYWNYTGAMDIRSYVKIYQHAFRVFYTAVKGRNADSRVFFSIDNIWNDSSQTNGTTYYKGKDVLDQFNSVAAEEGQIDWGLAYHPYPYPMTDPVFWDDGNNGLTQDVTTPILNFYNLHVLTDYMQTDAMRSPTGKVRHITLSEQGFTSMTPGGNKLQEQAAAFAYSYYLTESNPYIESYLLSRQTDAPTETQSSTAFGLYYCDENSSGITATHSKPIYSIFRDIDRAGKSLQVSADCKKTLGISKWSELIPNFVWSGSE